MIAAIQSLNYVLFFLGAVLLGMVAMHLHWGLRFSARQERQALRLFWAYLFFVTTNHVLSAALATVPNLENVGVSLPALASFYLLTKIGSVLAKIGMVLWVLLVFWPSQERAP